MPRSGDTSILGRGESSRKHPEEGRARKSVLLFPLLPLLLLILFSGGFEKLNTSLFFGLGFLVEWVKRIVEGPRNGILLNRKKELDTDTCSEVAESRKSYAE